MTDRHLLPWEAALRPAGEAPFWEAGAVVWWHYRRRTWQPGDPETVHPMRVVADDDRALVAWLAGGTSILAPTLPSGRHVREGPIGEMFTAPRIQGRMLWKGRGTLRIAPTGRPWSVWMFWDGADFDGWYVNLETPHRRDGQHTYSADHVLDVLVAPDLTWRLKDEHELVAAVEQGRYTAAEAEAIRADGATAVEVIEHRGFPFGSADEHWRSWRPDPGWGTPGLPPELEGPAAPRPAAYPRGLRPEDSRY
ncbi:MAG: DUF402 domain-containing protein [Lapillicoccus sp.]